MRIDTNDATAIKRPIAESNCLVVEYRMCRTNQQKGEREIDELCVFVCSVLLYSNL